MLRVCAAFCACVSVAACDETLVVVDAGVGEVDGGFVDAGVADAGVIDAGFVDAGVEDCVIEEVEEFPFVPNGTEDLIDPRGDAPYPDVDVLAMWSRMEGDTWVVEIQFAAPPFRRTTSTGVGFGLDRRPEVEFGNRSIVACLVAPCFGPQPENAEVPVSGVVAVQADFGVWPPDFIGSALSDFPPTAFRPPCDYVFATPSQPFVQLRFAPEIAPPVDWPAPYHWTTSFVPLGADLFFEPDHSWVSVDDPFFVSRGGAAPTTERFVSVCDLTCEEIQGEVREKKM